MHWPHLHWPAIGKFFERAWDAFIGPFIAFGELVASLPWAEIAGSIARWTMRNIIGPITEAINWIIDRILEFGEMLWLIFSNPCKISISDFIDAMKRAFTIGNISSNQNPPSNDVFSMADAAERSLHMVAGTACTLVVIWFELVMAGFNVLCSIIVMLADKCDVFKGKNPTMRVAVSYTGTVPQGIHSLAVTPALGLGFDIEYNKFCFMGIALVKGWHLPPETPGPGKLGVAPEFGLGTPGSGSWVNLFSIGMEFQIPLFNISFAFSLCYKYHKKMSKFRAIGGTVKVGPITAKSALQFKVQVGKAYAILCYLAGHFEGLTCNEHYGARDGQ